MANPLETIGVKARSAAGIMAHATMDQKNAALKAIGEGLKKRTPALLAANANDYDAAKKALGDAPAQAKEVAALDRLRMSDGLIQAMAASVDVIRGLPDPVGRLVDTLYPPNGLVIEKRGVPIGVIGIIFESRPNVALDAAALCIKSGNVCILRGGSDGWQSIEVLVDIVQKGLEAAGLPREAVQLVPSSDRGHVGNLLTLDQYVDLIIPRGGKSLNQRVKAESRIPVLGHLEGICHTYIDAGADPAKAAAITKNAKMRRPSVCGATECLLLHKDIVGTIGKKVVSDLLDAGCEVRAPEHLLPLDKRLTRSQGNDYGVEFLAPILAVAMVENVEGAVAFINTYGSQHTDAIVTEDQAAADYFLSHVGSAIAVHNASTQFADGGEFGKGAEIGIATGRIQARGPVGLEELTTYQYRVLGTGQVRPA